MKNDLARVNQTVNNLSTSGAVSDLSGDVEEYKEQTTSELAALNSQMEKIDGSMKQEFSSLNDTINIIKDHVEKHENRMITELMELENNLEQIIPMYSCGGVGGWRRVVYLDMTDPNTNCPPGWQLTSYSKRTCGGNSTGSLTCDSIIFPVNGGYYDKVCGRIKAYQSGLTDAFEAYDRGVVTTIEGAYVSGISLTHGNLTHGSFRNRTHIWTFAAGIAEGIPDQTDACPCDVTTDIAIPPFVGDDYFCESGFNSGSRKSFFPDDPLWDGNGCTTSSTCCSFGNPPYFTKELPNHTNDGIEVRICRYDNSGDYTPIEFIELYVK